MTSRVHMDRSGGTLAAPIKIADLVAIANQVLAGASFTPAHRSAVIALVRADENATDAALARALVQLTGHRDGSGIPEAERLARAAMVARRADRSRR